MDQIEIKKISPKTARLYITAIKSYLGFHDIDIIPIKAPREDEETIDVHDVRKFLLKCSNRQLRAYLLVLASGGMRTVEALAVRIKDIDFTVNPTKIHIRGEFSKTPSSKEDLCIR